MQYFGVPKCPYCGKRVNLIRSWSLKKEGEYKCPRCSGISNIFLSPLVYVFAVLAIFFGTIIYFFYKFVSNSIDIKTIIYVLIPFVAFFILSLFTPYLKKPVIKKAPPNKRKNPNTVPQATGQHLLVSPTVEMPAVDEKDYLPSPNFDRKPIQRAVNAEQSIQVEAAIPEKRQPLPRTRIASINDDIAGSEQFLSKKRPPVQNNDVRENKRPVTNKNQNFKVNYEDAEMRNTAGKANKPKID